MELTLDSVNNTLTTHAGLIQTNADTINTQADTIKTQAGLIQANADAIAANAGTISLQAEEIQLKADKTYVDNLVANYATVEELDSVRAWISDLEGGLGTLSVLNAGIANITDANTTYLSAASFTFAGGLVSRQAISMGAVSTAGGVLSTGELNLQHSHKITEENGVVTLGEVSSTGGSFNIATTKFYKDGVAAAENGVYVVSMSGSGGIITAKLSNKKEGTMRLAKGTPDGTNIPVVSEGGSTVMTVDATSVYNNGWNDCRSAASSQRVLINYYSAGETLYDRDGNVATGPWYKGTEAYRYSLPSEK